MKDKTQHMTHLIRQTINTIDPDAEVILYGPRVRGNESSESYWDLIILTNYSVDLNTEQKFRDKL